MSISTIPGLPAAISGKSASPGLGDLLLESGLPLDFAALLAGQIPASGQAAPALAGGDAAVSNLTSDPLAALKEIIVQAGTDSKTRPEKAILPDRDKTPAAAAKDADESTESSAAAVLAALTPRPAQPTGNTRVTEADPVKAVGEKPRKAQPESEQAALDPALLAPYVAPALAQPVPKQMREDAAPEQTAALDALPKAGKTQSPLATPQDRAQPAETALQESRDDATPATPTLPQAASSLVEPRQTQRSDTANAAILAGDGNPGNSGNTPAFTSALAATGAAATTTAPHPNQPAAITTPINQPSWPHDFGNRIVWLAKNDQQVAQININPPQLGPVQVSISINGDQASASFISPHAEVRQAIHDSLPQLREMLSTAGISLGQANVGSQMPSQNREASYQFANEARSTGENAILSPDSHANPAPAGIPINRGRGLVDLFA